jgi:hypothetical protein
MLFNWWVCEKPSAHGMSTFKGSSVIVMLIWWLPNQTKSMLTWRLPNLLPTGWFMVLGGTQDCSVPISVLKWIIDRNALPPGSGKNHPLMNIIHNIYFFLYLSNLPHMPYLSKSGLLKVQDSKTCLHAPCFESPRFLQLSRSA